MSPDELNNSLCEQPSKPFRIVLTDGVAYEVRHPELLWVGQRTVYVGLSGDAAQICFDTRDVKVDLLHITRVEPLEHATQPPSNGSPSQ